MTIFTVNQQKCRQDGLCAAVCPRGIIKLDEKTSFPIPVDGAEELCIHCGHCSGVCPEAALRLPGSAQEEGKAFDPAQLPSPEQFYQLVRGRRSIRNYRKKPVSREAIAQLIDLCRHAPTARNSQLLQWLVIDSPQEVQTLKNHTKDWMADAIATEAPIGAAYNFAELLKSWDDSHDPILRGAPGLLIVHAPADYPFALVDATIATATFELAAACSRLGTCWAGFFMIAYRSWPPLRKALSLPAENELVTALMVGYPKFRYSSLPERNDPVITWR